MFLFFNVLIVYGCEFLTFAFSCEVLKKLAASIMKIENLR